jgi:hypothetical protein
MKEVSECEFDGQFKFKIFAKLAVFFWTGEWENLKKLKILEQFFVEIIMLVISQAFS